MPRNGSGSYSLPQPPFVTGTVISATAVNSDLSDIASALTQSISSDGQTPITGSLQGFSGTAATPGYAFQGANTTGLFSVSQGIGFTVAGTQVGTVSAQGFSNNAGIPLTILVGTIQDFAGSSVPVGSGWYLCYGQAVSRSTYSTLFGVIGTTYGSGDGVTTFNLPDLRGRVGYGVDNMGGTPASRLTSTYYGTSADVLAAAGGTQNATLTTGQVPQFTFTPTGSVTSTVVPGGNSGGLFWGTVSSSPSVTAPTGGALDSGLNAFTVSSSFSGNAISIGSASPNGVATVAPGITLNKIIFAGA